MFHCQLTDRYSIDEKKNKRSTNLDVDFSFLINRITNSSQNVRFFLNHQIVYFEYIIIK